MRDGQARFAAERRLHVAILMDGNGRWAAARGLPRSEGHRAGLAAVRRVVRAAPGLGISTLTLYAFSSHNWARPASEVASLFRLLEDYFCDAINCREQGLRIRVIGRRDRIPASLASAIEYAEQTTKGGRRLELRIAIDYSSREAILRAAGCVRPGPKLSEEEFARQLGEVTHGSPRTPDIDLLIRTGGERRLSDFMLWEIAYAELLFLQRMWPEFGTADLEAALDDFLGRERRYGRVPETAAS